MLHQAFDNQCDGRREDRYGRVDEDYAAREVLPPKLLLRRVRFRRELHRLLQGVKGLCAGELARVSVPWRLAQKEPRGKRTCAHFYRIPINRLQDRSSS